MAGKHQMADEDAPPEKALFHNTGASLAEHLPDGSGGHGKIVRGAGELPRQVCIGVFQVRQIYLNFPV